MAGNDNVDNVFSKLKGKARAAVRSLPRVLGREAVVWVKQSWDRQGWLDEGLQPWQPRKRNSKKNAGKAILIQAGRLRRSIDIMSESGMTVIIGTDVPYGKIHNYGGIISQAARSETFIRNRRKSGKFKKGVTRGQGFSFRQRTIVIPRRQFIGKSTSLILRLQIVGKNHLSEKMK